MMMITAAAPTANDRDRDLDTTMQAVTQDRFGTAEVLTVGTVDRPQIADNQVLIQVHAAAVDRGTEHLMTGLPYLIRVAGFGFTKPKQPVLGLDVSGRVIAVGADVTRFSIGDEVFGIADGSLAEYAAADQDKLVLKPANVSFEQAAASAVSGITALQALTDVGGLQAGQRVLIVGASGGVGTFAVQLARALGAVVHGVAGPRSQDIIAALGAARVFDYRSTALGDIGETYDLILDIGGRNPVRVLRSLLVDGGTLVFVGGEDGNRVTGGIGRQVGAVAMSPLVSQRLAMFVSREHHSSIERLAEFMERDEVRAAIGSRFSLDQAPQAMHQLASGNANGKSVIVVRDEPDERQRVDTT